MPIASLSAAAKVRQSGKRSAGSLFRARSKIGSRAARSGRTLLIGAAGFDSTAAISAVVVSAWKGASPVSILYSEHASAYWSLAGDAGRPSMISGAE